MSEREIGIEEARKILGPLADDAALDGTVTYLTRRGRRYAAIVPLNRIKESTMTTTATITEQITTTLGDRSGDFDLSGVAEAIGDAYGRDLTDIDTIPSEEYWAIVAQHDKTA